ncbi:MAG: SMC-Scp complex subunit ScpB [Methanomethylophilus sp.]
MEDKTAVEAALFAATGPLRPADIAARTGLDESAVTYALRELRREYDLRDSAVIISSAAGEYRMILRPDCARFTDLFARPDLPGGAMRTLSTIAYNQPVLQSKLVTVRGPRTYDDVRLLKERGLVSARPAGQTFELTTTARFSEAFGLGSTRKADIKKWIEKQARERAAQVPPPAPAADDGQEPPV